MYVCLDRMHTRVLSRFSHVQLFATPQTVACQSPLFMGFSRQEYWSGLLCPSPWDLPDPGIKSMSPAMQVDSLLLSHWGSPSPSLPLTTFFWASTMLGALCQRKQCRWETLSQKFSVERVHQTNLERKTQACWNLFNFIPVWWSRGP